MPEDLNRSDPYVEVLVKVEVCPDLDGECGSEEKDQGHYYVPRSKIEENERAR